MTAEQQFVNTAIKEYLQQLRQQIKYLMKTVEPTDDPEEISAVYFNNMALFNVLDAIDEHITEVDK